MNKTYRESKKNQKAYTKDELYRKEAHHFVTILYGEFTSTSKIVF